MYTGLLRKLSGARFLCANKTLTSFLADYSEGGRDDKGGGDVDNRLCSASTATGGRLNRGLK